MLWVVDFTVRSIKAGKRRDTMLKKKSWLITTTTNLEAKLLSSPVDIGGKKLGIRSAMGVE